MSTRELSWSRRKRHVGVLETKKMIIYNIIIKRTGLWAGGLNPIDTILNGIFGAEHDLLDQHIRLDIVPVQPLQKNTHMTSSETS